MNSKEIKLRRNSLYKINIKTKPFNHIKLIVSRLPQTDISNSVEKTVEQHVQTENNNHITFSNISKRCDKYIQTNFSDYRNINKSKFKINKYTEVLNLIAHIVQKLDQKHLLCNNLQEPNPRRDGSYQQCKTKPIGKKKSHLKSDYLRESGNKLGNEQFCLDTENIAPRESLKKQNMKPELKRTDKTGLVMPNNDIDLSLSTNDTVFSDTTENHLSNYGFIINKKKLILSVMKYLEYRQRNENKFHDKNTYESLKRDVSKIFKGFDSSSIGNIISSHLYENTRTLNEILNALNLKTSGKTGSRDVYENKIPTNAQEPVSQSTPNTKTLNLLSNLEVNNLEEDQLSIVSVVTSSESNEVAAGGPEIHSFQEEVQELLSRREKNNVPKRFCWTHVDGQK